MERPAGDPAILTLLTAFDVPVPDEIEAGRLLWKRAEVRQWAASVRQASQGQVRPAILLEHAPGPLSTGSFRRTWRFRLEEQHADQADVWTWFDVDRYTAEVTGWIPSAQARVA